MKKLSERLESASSAYPEDLFGDITDEDRRNHPELIQRAAAQMGRHLSGLLKEAAELARSFEAAPKVKVRGKVGEVCMVPISHDFCGKRVRIVPEKEG